MWFTVPVTILRAAIIIGSGSASYEIIHHLVQRVPVPFGNITFYSYFASLLTPVPASIIAGLMGGLKDEVVCRDTDIRKLIPFEPLSYRKAIVRALTREEQDKVYTRWSDAYPPAHELAIKLHELKGVAVFTVSFSLTLFHSVCQIEGKFGWFNNNWMWKAAIIHHRLLLLQNSLGHRLPMCLPPLPLFHLFHLYRTHQALRGVPFCRTTLCVSIDAKHQQSHPIVYQSKNEIATTMREKERVSKFIGTKNRGKSALGLHFVRFGQN